MSDADLEAWLAERFEAEPAQAPDVPFDLSPVVMPARRVSASALRRAQPWLCAMVLLAIAMLGQGAAIDAARELHAPLLAPEARSLAAEASSLAAEASSFAPQASSFASAAPWLRALLGPVDSVAGVLGIVFLVLRVGWRALAR